MLSIYSYKVHPDVMVIWFEHYYVHGYTVSCVCRCCLCWEDGETLLSIILSATAAVSARQSFSQSTIRSLLRLEAVDATDASGGCCCCVWKLLMSRLDAVAAAAVSGLSGSSGRGLDEEVGAFRRGWARTDVDRPRRIGRGRRSKADTAGTGEGYRGVVLLE